MLQLLTGLFFGTVELALGSSDADLDYFENSMKDDVGLVKRVALVVLGGF